MKEEILDRRVRKTRRQLKECLTRLLKEKKIQDITVRELAEMADINRGTFYLHYKDVFDLMDQIKNELIEEVESVLTHHPVPELVARPSLALSELFPLVQENADVAFRAKCKMFSRHLQKPILKTEKGRFKGL